MTVDAQPLVRIAELEIDPGQLPAYLDELRREIANSLATEPGALQLQAVQLAEAPHEIRLIEVYRDRDAYEGHIRSPHFIAYKAATAGMVVALHLIDATPVAMRL